MEQHKRKITIIGAGITGLSSAALLAKKGYDVTVLEMNEGPGGRAMVWQKDGYRFDMGPSWYMMIEAFERLFKKLETSPDKHYKTIRLSPSYRVHFEDGSFYDISDDVNENIKLYDSFEKDGGSKLKRFLEQSQIMYDIATQKFLYKDYNKFGDLLDRSLLIDGLKLNIFTRLDKYISKFFNSEKASKISSYHVAFVGASPPTSPAVYAMLAHCDMNLGIWYPMGGFGKIMDSLEEIGRNWGAKYQYGTEVEKIIVNNNRATSMMTSQGKMEADIILNTGDYHHGEMVLLEKQNRSYKEKYWKNRVMAPSAFLVYLGLNKKVKNFLHHNFYFNSDWDTYFNQLFGKNPEWPEEPSIYVTVPSKSDPTIIPEGGDLMTILVLVSADLINKPIDLEQYFDTILAKVESFSGENIRDSIVVKRIVAHDYFNRKLNAFKGTALGMAHTLLQTALFRPHHKSKKINNLYYAGQYTHPGVGVPVSIISAELAVEQIMDEIIKNKV